jgi:hypothetical protein
VFIGHIAVALGAKKASPRTSLAVLLAAAELPDLIGLFVLLYFGNLLRPRPSAKAVAIAELFM